ncbi:unnamed protein product [Protopolystoma xenopodis]|uniref:Uncharacterized protein n=1 Tax=Protopolystoma xenopodis TaxID=117903 RepID=A0A3S5A7Q8_9PLAT|nr:unnamed protein product [Protopolystoma xenopodis]
MIGASAVILTGLLVEDENGIRDWLKVDAKIDPQNQAEDKLLSDLLTASKVPTKSALGTAAPAIHLLLGLPLYATSVLHEWFKNGITDTTSTFADYYIWRQDPVSYPERTS